MIMKMRTFAVATSLAQISRYSVVEKHGRYDNSKIQHNFIDSEILRLACSAEDIRLTVVVPKSRAQVAIIFVGKTRKDHPLDVKK